MNYSVPIINVLVLCFKMFNDFEFFMSTGILVVPLLISSSLQSDFYMLVYINLHPVMN